MASFFRANVTAMHGYVPGEQPKSPRLVKLNTNENPYPPSPRVAEALAGDWSRLNRYPDPVATPVREAVAELTGLTPDWVLAGNGSDDILTIVTRACVESGGVVVSPEPSYSLYPILADIQGAEYRGVPLTDDFGLPDDFAAQCLGASLCYLAHPNAPTGRCYPHETLAAFCDAFDGLVLLDEAYVDFADKDGLPLLQQCPNVVVSRTLSKGYSLAGIRLGFAIAHPELIAELAKVKDSYNVNALTQAIGAAALRDQEHKVANAERIRATRARVVAELSELAFETVPSHTNFLFTRPPLPAADCFAALREREVIVRYFPGERTGEFLRVTIGTDKEMDAFLAAVRELLEG